MKFAAMVVACTGLVIGASAFTPALGAEPSLRFRGTGSARAALDSMQLKAFDQSLWSNLGNWQGKAPAPADMDGKVVLIVTWAEWYRPSWGAVKSAGALAEQYKKDLVVVGVHNPRGWDKAADNAKALGINFPYAEDKDGKFRAALKADQDPNVYVIDRAGNLRYAQLEVGSMDDAVAALVAETAQGAKDYPAKLAKEKAEAERAKWKTGEASAIAPGQELDVQFEDPDDEAYKGVKWPYFIGKVEQDKILETWSNTPPKLEMVEDQWVPAAPKQHGKLLVVYLFDPKETDMLNVIPAMNRLQDRNRRDVSVAGVAVKLGEAGLNVQGEEHEKLTKRNSDLLKGVLATRSPNHPLQPQPLKGDQFEFQSGGGSVNGIPLFGTGRENFGVAMLLSTDHKVRWIGNPYNPDLNVAIEKVAAVDPGVQARRKAEAAKTKTK